MNREFRATYKEIWRKQRSLAVSVILAWLLALVVVIVSIALLEPKYLRTLEHYTNLGIVNYYLTARWYYAIIFPVAALALAIFWSIFIAQLYTKKGVATARLFAILSYFVFFSLGVAAVRVLLFNAELS